MGRDRIHLPGLPRDAARVLIAEIEALKDEQARLRRKAGRAGIVTSDYSAKAGEFVNVEPRSGALVTITLPESTPALRGARITLAFRNSNDVRIVAVQGTVNGEAFVMNDRPGTYDATADGLGGWFVQVGVSDAGSGAGGGGGSSTTDAEYVLGASDASIPNGRVATDSTEIDAVLTTPNVITWALNVASVAFSKLSNLAGLSVLGRAASTTGVMAAITSTSAKQVLRNAGANLHWEYPVSVGSPFVWIFDGVDDRADYGDVLDMDRTTARSIFFWYATTSTAGPCVIGKQATSTSAGWRFCVSNSTLDWILRGSTQQLQVGLTTPAPLDGSMHLLGMTYTGSSNASGVEFYLDTVNVPKTIGTNNLTSESTQNAASLLVGRRGTDAHFTGGIQHVSVWNRVLTPGEVDQLSDGGAPADLASLSFFSDCILWSKFDGTDTTGASGIADHSASNFDATAQGGLAPTGGDEQVHTFVEGGGVDLSVLENVCTVTREALTGDITAAAGSNVTDITAGAIVNADVNASAAIAQTKLGATTGFSVKASGASATTSAEPIVTYSASANMSAERVTTSSTSVTVDTTTASQIEFRRAALTGDVTASANSNATTLADGVVTPAKLAVVASNRGVTFAVHVAFTASGATGTLIDVTVWNANAPFALRILGAELRVSVAGGTASAVRTASGGGGSVVLPDVAAATQTFSTAATGRKFDAAAATATVAANGSVFFNVDRAVTGELVLWCVRT